MQVQFVLGLASVLVASNAFAEVRCQVGLFAQGREIMEFEAGGSDYRSACSQPMQNCEQNRQAYYPYGYCAVVNGPYNPYPPQPYPPNPYPPNPFPPNPYPPQPYPPQPNPGGNYQQIFCESYNYRYETCYADGYIERASIARVFSTNNRCIYNVDWGYESNQGFIWVNNGCRATFNVTTRRYY